MVSAEVQKAQEAPSLNLFEKALAVSVSIHMIGDKRKVKVEKNGGGDDGPKEEGTLSIDTEADERLLKVSKTILECEEYAAIKTLAGEVRTYMRLKSVPGCQRLIRSGVYLISLQILEDVDSKMKEFQNQMRVLTAKLCEVYETRVEEAKQRLKDLFQEKDYPPVKSVRRSCSIDYEFVSIGPPTSLAGIRKDIYDREVAKVKQNCAVMYEETRTALRVLFQELLDHMVDRLTPSADGKRKIFKDSLIGNMKEFLQDFQARNITDDTELNEVVKKCQSILQGRNPNELRRNQSARELVASRLTKIKSTVDGLVEKSVSRRFEVDD